MNIKHLFFCMLLIAFSSCSKPGYEKAIAEWVQTDSHGTWTDLKFELLEVLETEDVTVSDSLCYLNNKSAQLSAVIQKAESPRALFKPSFSAYMEAEKSLKATDAMKAMYLHRDSTEVIGKILKCRYAIVQPHSGVQQKKTASFLLSPDMEKCHRQTKSRQANNPSVTMCSDTFFWFLFGRLPKKNSHTFRCVAIHYTTILSLINGILSRTKFRIRS